MDNYISLAPKILAFDSLWFQRFRKRICDLWVTARPPAFQVGARNGKEGAAPSSRALENNILGCKIIVTHPNFIGVKLSMSRKLTSKIWSIDRETLESIVKKCSSIAEIIRQLSYGAVTGGTYKSVKERLRQDGIDFAHIQLGLSNRKGIMPATALSKEEAVRKWFVRDKSISSNHNIINHIKRHNLIDYRCEKCSNSGDWQGSELTLQLDHIDGDANNNQIENLRWLCPNCHSQTPTFCGRRLRKVYLCKCGNSITKGSVSCMQCAGESRAFVKFPGIENMQQLVWKHAIPSLSQILNCSQGAIRKFCKKHGIELPKRGYWQRISAGYSHEKSIST